MPFKSKEDARAYMKKWREENKEKIRKQDTERHRKYRATNPEKFRQDQRKYRAMHKEEWQAYMKKWCEENKEKIVQDRKEYNLKNKKQLSEKHRKYRLTPKGKEMEGKRNEKYYKKNREHILILSKKIARRKKMQVYLHYGKGRIECACCGEKEIGFLSLDHIHNNGNLHRKKTRDVIGWAIRNDYPPILQVLCMNCNNGKYRNGGICPHLTNGVAVA